MVLLRPSVAKLGEGPPEKKRHIKDSVRTMEFQTTTIFHVALRPPEVSKDMTVVMELRALKWRVIDLVAPDDLFAGTKHDWIIK